MKTTQEKIEDIRKACIAANRHHYNETARSYAISACHNDELRNVIEFLKNK